MIDETNTPDEQGRPAAGPGGLPSDPVGYCQQCGRVLFPATLRRIGNGIFCEPCATARTVTGWQPVTPGTTPAAVPAPPSSDEPNPVLAGALGFIPGVGAMYNGQYAKAALHLVVFVVLVALADNLSWVLWWLVWGWIFYQVFEAYHTARARRDHLPLPDPFGWNDIGDRLGFGRNWPGPIGTAAAPGTASRRAGANWMGYVPPAPPPATPPPVASPDPNLNPYTASYTPAPPINPVAPPPGSILYTPTYTGPASAEAAAYQNTRRFPMGAVWLIALGVLFLLGNLLPEWRLSARWLVPVLLAMLAVWGGIRRIELLRGATAQAGSRPDAVGALIGPTLLLTVAALLALQNADLLPLRHSWPVLLVVWGAMLLAQRAAGPLLHGGSDVVNTVQPPPASSTPGAGPLGL